MNRAGGETNCYFYLFKTVCLIGFRTKRGEFLIDDSTRLLNRKAEWRGKTNFILTSPPFPLNKKKRYGNLTGEDYLEWFETLAPLFSEVLAQDGSVVIELGNAWEPGRPAQSLLSLKALLAFVEHPDCSFRLIQEFVCYNPSRLPSPAEWVTKHRIRTIDSYTHVWWIAKTDRPKADNRKVLRPYSKSMKDLLRRQSFNRGNRPSGHHISREGFLTDHGGSIAHNFLEMEPVEQERENRIPRVADEYLDRLPVNALSLSNTNSNDYFMRRLRSLGLPRHPAPMQAGLAAFFIQFLTDEGDVVLDPFAGTNTTNYCAERLSRQWISIEKLEDYGLQTYLRMQDPEMNTSFEYIRKTLLEKLASHELHAKSH
jgi:site-specific DNA-methyltransferase (cytosine-N4-specific)